MHLGPRVRHRQPGLRVVPAVVEIAHEQQLALDPGQPRCQVAQFGGAAGGTVGGVVAAEVGHGHRDGALGRLDDSRGHRLVRAEDVQSRLAHGQPAEQQQSAVRYVMARRVGGDDVPGPYPVAVEQQPQ